MKKTSLYHACIMGLMTVLLASAYSVQYAIAQSGGPIKSKDYPQGYFRSPLDIPHQASGTFGELRSTHFHAGDDYRTQQKVGLPLYAIADGYVSRIRVQIGGGGNSVYITHPNGYTSVYLHMHEFSARLTARLRKEQYAAERFDVDITLGPEEFPLKKGERFGLAGNSGSSEGPHLHFEIRDTDSGDPINPQLFGLHFPDKVPPLIHNITIYDLGDGVFNEHTPRRHFKTSASGSGQYQLERKTAIPVNGRFGVGIQTVDRHTGTTFNNGVYSIELLLDGKPVSTAVFERLSFDWSGAIHSYIDYPYFVESRTRVQKSFKDPNSPVGIFRQLEGDGSIRLDAGSGVKNISYRVRDIHGNTSLLRFAVSQDASYTPARPQQTGTALFHYGQANQYEADNIRMVMPEGALYNDLYFNYVQGVQPEKGYSLVQHVHNNLTPLAKAYELGIRPDSSLPEHLRPKALIVDARGGSHGGVFRDGFVFTQTRSFGSFHIRVDTVAPNIQALNIGEGRNMAGQSRISLRISDNLSGIASFRGYIDGKWVLMEYDPKTRSLWHTFTHDLPKGRHRFRLEVRDHKDNESRFELNFIR